MMCEANQRFLIICNGARAFSRGNLVRVKINPLFPLLLAVTALALSCGGDFSAKGTYEGKLVVEDGTKFVKLELQGGNKARVRGFFTNLKEGTWVEGSTRAGSNTPRKSAQLRDSGPASQVLKHNPCHPSSSHDLIAQTRSGDGFAVTLAH